MGDPDVPPDQPFDGPCESIPEILEPGVITMLDALRLALRFGDDGAADGVLFEFRCPEDPALVTYALAGHPLRLEQVGFTAEIMVMHPMPENEELPPSCSDMFLMRLSHSWRP